VSFRARLTIAAAAAVAVAVVLASVVVYVVVRNQLRGEIDDSLRGRVHAILEHPISLDPTGKPGEFFAHIPPAQFGGAPGYVQLVGSRGQVALSEHETVRLPVSDRARGVAARKEGTFFADEHVAGAHVRVLTTYVDQGWALQIARNLGEVDATLSRVEKLLLLIGLGGIGVATGLGLLVARTALAPVRRLTETTEHVTETRDLGRRIDVTGRDELSRLATSFNAMLTALEEAARSQRQLVADASHELRTPLTSLRTNIEVLARDESLPHGEREKLLSDVVEQLVEMTMLVSELVELARGDREPAEAEDVRLDLLVQEAIERTRRNRPEVTFDADLEESLVRGVPMTIERAIANLLDNAAKWSPAGGTVEVAVREAQVMVRDHGPGIAEEDLPFVFDRFYRAASARGQPGSGLGLAIVRQVAEAHGGEVTAERAEGGGTRMRLRLDGGARPADGADSSS